MESGRKMRTGLWGDAIGITPTVIVLRVAHE
jgi:hypothetical protein